MKNTVIVVGSAGHETDIRLLNAINHLVSEGHTVELVEPDDERLKVFSAHHCAPPPEVIPEMTQAPKPILVKGMFDPLSRTRAQRRAKAREQAKRRR